MIKQKSFTYDFIKIITTFLVIVAHAARMYTDVGAITPANESGLLNQLCNFIYSFHMPLFICVSGMVYGLCVDDLGKYTDKVAFIKNKALRLLIPYFFFGILYVAPTMVLLDLTDQSFVGYIIQGILLARNSRHLWFLLALFWIFLFVIFAQKLLNKIHNGIILLVLLIVAYYSHLVPNTFAINSFLYYLIFFYLGKLLNQYYVIVKSFRNVATVGCGTSAIIGICNSDIFLVEFLCAVIGISVIAGVAQYADKKIQETFVFKKLKQNSFGIYLFHPMIIYLIFYLLGDKNIYPIVLLVISVVVSFVLSYALTELFRKIKLGIFIGE